MAKFKKSNPPTPAQMAEFASLFEHKGTPKCDWKLCCQHQEFVEAVTTDLILAESIARKILSGTFKSEKEVIDT